MFSFLTSTECIFIIKEFGFCFVSKYSVKQVDLLAEMWTLGHRVHTNICALILITTTSGRKVHLYSIRIRNQRGLIFSGEVTSDFRYIRLVLTLVIFPAVSIWIHTSQVKIVPLKRPLHVFLTSAGVGQESTAKGHILMIFLLFWYHTAPTPTSTFRLSCVYCRKWCKLDTSYWTMFMIWL